MNRGSTWFLRAVVILLALIVALICYAVLPAVPSQLPATLPAFGRLAWPITIGLSLTAIAFYVALLQTLKLLQYIDQQKVFSTSAVKALQNIKRSALVISSLYAVGLPVSAQITNQVDPPLGLFNMVIVLISAGVGVFAGVLQGLLQTAIKIKSENDLTV